MSGTDGVEKLGELLRRETIVFRKGAEVTERDVGGSEGPSYIELGGWLGDQELALRLMVLSAHYGTSGAPVTPALFGAEGDDADALAGRGMVMLGGWKP